MRKSNQNFLKKVHLKMRKCISDVMLSFRFLTWASHCVAFITR